MDVDGDVINYVDFQDGDTINGRIYENRTAPRPECMLPFPCARVGGGHFSQGYAVELGYFGFSALRNAIWEGYAGHSALPHTLRIAQSRAESLAYTFPAASPWWAGKQIFISSSPESRLQCRRPGDGRPGLGFCALIL
jgi:hypothetical protein